MAVYEPTTAPQGLSFSATAGRNAERIRGVAAGLAFGNDTGANIGIRTAGVWAGIAFGAIAGRQRTTGRGAVAGLAFSSLAGGINYSAWIRKNLSRAIFRYYARITGDVTDCDLTGLKSFQFRRRFGVLSYLSLSLVYSDKLLTSISERSQGKLVLDMAALINDDESLREELIRVDFYSCRYDKGGQNQSITLVGYGPQENTSSRVALMGVTTETMLADGRMQYRCARPDFYLKPGDTAVYGGHAFMVDQVSAVVSLTFQYMDVSE
jgi:hypothetical protein